MYLFEEVVTPGEVVKVPGILGATFDGKGQMPYRWSRNVTADLDFIPDRALLAFRLTRLARRAGVPSIVGPAIDVRETERTGQVVTRDKPHMIGIYTARSVPRQERIEVPNPADYAIKTFTSLPHKV